MSRRPHWDDDLIDAVFRALSHTYRAQGWTGGIAIDLDESVYPLIAAVEDWQDANGFGRMGSLMRRLIDAEAAIQRVRELHHPIPGFNGTQWCGAHCEATADGDPTEYPCETIRALDGGAE